MQGTNKLRGTTLISVFGSQLVSECRLSISLTRCHVPSYFPVRMHRFKRAAHMGISYRTLPKDAFSR